MRPNKVISIVIEAPSSLTGLAAIARDAHWQVERLAGESIDNALRAGLALNEAKKRLGHGKWLPWLSENVGISERTARRYMRVDHHRDELANRPRHGRFEHPAAEAMLATVSDAVGPDESQEPTASPPPEQRQAPDVAKQADLVDDADVDYGEDDYDPGEQEQDARPVAEVQPASTPARTPLPPVIPTPSGTRHRPRTATTTTARTARRVPQPTTARRLSPPSRC